MDMAKIGFRIVGFVGVIGFLSPAVATEQVYHPISPALGGNSNNGTFLLSTAQSQGEGVNSGNSGPTINFPPGFGTTPSTSGTQNNAANGSTVANPLAGRAGMP